MLTDGSYLSSQWVFLFFFLPFFCTLQPFKNKFCCLESKKYMDLLTQIEYNAISDWRNRDFESLWSASILKRPSVSGKFPKASWAHPGGDFPWAQHRAPLRPLPQLLGAGPVATRLPCRPGLPYGAGSLVSITYEFRCVWRINELLKLAFFISWSFLLNGRFQTQPTTAMFHLPLYFWFVCLNTRSQAAPLFLRLLLSV